MNYRPPKDAPKDGSRILLLFTVWHYWEGEWKAEGLKWEECRWVSDPAYAPPHWEPWCGREDTFSTQHIKEKDIIGWVPIPEKWRK